MSVSEVIDVREVVTEFLSDQHRALEIEERERGISPRIEEIENYYIRNPDMYNRDKIMSISTLSSVEKAHAIRHIEMKLGILSEGEMREIAEYAMRPIVRLAPSRAPELYPAEVEEKRTYRIEYDSKGRMHARDKKTGKFRKIPARYR